MSDIVKSRDLDRLHEVLAHDLVDHDPAADQPAGADGIVWFWRGFVASFPDASMDYHVVVGAPAPDDDPAGGELVTIVATSRGTHTGEYQGHSPTGRRFEVRRMQVGRWVDGRMVERWGTTDEATLLNQLGLSG